MHSESLRDSYSWEELNRGGKAQMRAGHVYTVERPNVTRAQAAAGLRPRLLMAAAICVPVALVILQVVAAVAAR